MIVIREAWQAGLFRREHWLSNIIAGVVVGIVALPLAMAFAIASGAKPEQGLYTAIIAGFLVSAFGGSRLQIAGPTGAFIVILAAITAHHGIEGLQIATLMAGVMLLAIGLLRLGKIIRFIPEPVIVGFTAGIGVIIWVGQWKEFLGLPAVSGQHFHEKLWHLLQVLPQLHSATSLLALLSLAIVIATPHLTGLCRNSNSMGWLHKIPGPLIAMVVATALQTFYHYESVATIGSAFGGVPQGLPEFHLPAITFTRIVELIGPAFAIAMLCAIESLLCAVVADGMAGTKHDSNQELVGQGIANIVVPFFGGFAATGAIARTATNVRNGGNSPLAGMVHAIVLLLIILFLAPLAASIPLCTLAAILFVVAWNMSELPRMLRMVMRAPAADVAILLITFLLTVFTDLVVAVNIGVILATLNFMRRMSASVETRSQSAQTLAEEFSGSKTLVIPDNVVVYTIDGPVFFGAIESFEHALKETATDPAAVIIRLSHVPFMDITGLQSIGAVIKHLAQRGVLTVLCEAKPLVKAKLDRAGVLLTNDGQQHYCDTLPQAVAQVTQHAR